MQKYRYKVGTNSGQVEVELAQAESELALRRKLEADGYYVFSIEKEGGSLFSFEWGQRIPLTEFLVFNQELTILIKAGIPISKALHLLQERIENLFFKKIIGKIKDNVESGKSLSASFSQFSRLFSPVYIATLYAGETSGALVEVLKKFTAYQKEVLRFQKKVQQALIYPSILLILVVSIIFIFLNKIVPAFSKLYEDMQTQLPQATRNLMRISDFTRTYFWGVITVLLVMMVFLYYWKKTATGAKIIDRFILKIPFSGKVLGKYSLVQFVKTLQTTLEGGIPLPHSLELACEAMSNRYLATRIQPVIDKVKEGTHLAAALKESGVIPAMVTEMIGVGEETGSLEEMLENIATLYDEEINNNVNALLAVIEPVLILIMGLIVTAILISMYLPIFEMADRIGG